jgi:nitrogen fixation protein NifB
MRHCRQCRSDAVGLLGQNRSDEFSLDKVRYLRIDPQAAMAKRIETHEAIRQRLAERQGKIATPATLLSRPSSAPAPRAVLMAVASKGGSLIDEHFGQAHEFLLYEVTNVGARLLGRRRADLYCTGPADCGDGESRLNNIIRALTGCELLLCAKIGYIPWQKLESAGIQPNNQHALEPIEDALTAVYRELLMAGKLDKTSAVHQVSA